VAIRPAESALTDYAAATSASAGQAISSAIHLIARVDSGTAIIVLDLTAVGHRLLHRRLRRHRLPAPHL